jgi:anti-sigma factor RsiW
MTQLRGRSLSGLVAGLNAAQHLAIDAVVAFVDGELEPGAHDRAVAHIGHCTSCAAEVAAQRQARSAVRSAAEPAIPADLLAALCSIPERTELPVLPDGLAVTGDGTTVLTLRQPATGPALGSTPPLGSTKRLG